MISGLSLTIRDKRPTPRELFWRVAFLVCLQQIAHRAKYGDYKVTVDTQMPNGVELIEKI